MHSKRYVCIRVEMDMLYSSSMGFAFAVQKESCFTDYVNRGIFCKSSISITLCALRMFLKKLQHGYMFKSRFV